MRLTWQTFTVHKRFPLTISRGTTSENTNIWLRLQEDNLEGWGEASPFSISQEGYKDTNKLLKELDYIRPLLEKFSPLDRQEVEAVLLKEQISSATRAAIDMALYDWLGKRINLPLWQLWGLNRFSIVPVSVTIGINTPQGAVKRLKNWLEVVDIKIIKIKLGSPEGIEADQAMFLAIREISPNLKITVDANGGWSLEEAIKMCDWLAQHDVDYVEQPLAVEQEQDLSTLYQRSPLPIFVDESCFGSQDIPRLAAYVHGINIKIMKAGGLTEAIRMIHTAKACGLQIMFGCYSDSSLANTAMSHLAPLAHYLDLDSHLNLSDDPFRGASLEKGYLLPNILPGLGVTKLNNNLD